MANKITGYPYLSEYEIASMNRLKELERSVYEMLDNSPDAPDPRHAAIAKTYLEIGFIFAITSIAKPQ